MQGDSFHFAFPFARMQCRRGCGSACVHHYAWEAQPMSVRIGLHTGEPTQIDGLYAGSMFIAPRE